jgi:hypothetical protein
MPEAAFVVDGTGTSVSEIACGSSVISPARGDESGKEASSGLYS